MGCDPRGLGAAAFGLEGFPVFALIDREGVLKELRSGNMLGIRRRLRRDLNAIAGPGSKETPGKAAVER